MNRSRPNDLRIPKQFSLKMRMSVYSLNYTLWHSELTASSLNPTSMILPHAARPTLLYPNVCLPGRTSVTNLHSPVCQASYAYPSHVYPCDSQHTFPFKCPACSFRAPQTSSRRKLFRRVEKVCCLPRIRRRTSFASRQHHH